MEDQNIGQGQVVIEMNLLDDRPFADRAAEPTFPRDGTRQHRIAPDEPTGLLDGRQVRRYVVRVPPSRRQRQNFQTRRSHEESHVEQEITDVQRQWFRYRETRGIEDRRAPMSTESKWLLMFLVFLVILLIIVLVPYWFSGEDSGHDNLTSSVPLDEFHSLFNEAL
ncbi:unnamed protein product [Larinioides sclopetarius]|uniref:Uncharacterized protein n=1 Tax=Larinioides sclopetarius TaxID=280406 RepID=A0AAV2AKU2_9ARAC